MGANIFWETVNVKQMSRRGGEPFASIGQGRITLNATACYLLDDLYRFKFVEIKHGKEGGRVVKIGLQFLETKTQNALSVARRKYKGEIVDGLNINSKAIITEIFGKTKDSVSSRFSIEKMADNFLAIDISNEL